MRYAIAALLLVLSFVSCQSADTIARICEENNNECTQNCVITNANFSQTKLATTPIGECERRCENNYQACTKRQQNKAIRGTASY